MTSAERKSFVFLEGLLRYKYHQVNPVSPNSRRNGIPYLSGKMYLQPNVNQIQTTSITLWHPERDNNIGFRFEYA